MTVPQPVLRDLKLGEILRLAESGSLALPDFQRPFSWGVDETRSLLATVFLGWPAGLILLMEAPPENFFAVRSIEGATNTSLDSMRHLILDGQQRITALYQAFTPSQVGEPQWFIDVDKFLRGFEAGEVEDAFVRRTRGSVPRRGAGDDKGGVLIPIVALRDGFSFQAWRDESAGNLLYEEELQNHQTTLSSLWHAQLSAVSKFSFPCAVLPASMPLGSVARIFEKLNTSGLPLSTFDLVVAHAYRDGRNIRHVWDAAVAERPVLRAFAPSDPLIAVELICMVEKGDTRRNALLQLDPELLWMNWSRAVDALDVTSQFLSEKAGIHNIKHLPHRGLLLSLAGAVYRLGGLSQAFESTFLYWLFSRGLGERFDAAVNTRVVAEYKALVSCVEEGALISHLPLSRSWLQTATRRGNSSLWLSLMAMIRLRQPFDFPDGLISLHLNLESAQPVSILAGDDPGRQVGRVFGCILVSPQQARDLSGVGAPAFLRRVRQANRELVDDYLVAQMLPPLEGSAWREDESLVRYRAGIVLAELAQMEKQSAAEVEQSGMAERGGQAGSFGAGRSRGTPPPPIRVPDRLGAIQVLIEAGSVREAIDELNFALADPIRRNTEEFVMALLVRARALSVLKKNEEAVETWREALRISGSLNASELLVQAAAELGEDLVSRGRGDEGVLVLADALRTVPADAIPERLRSEMLVDYAQGLIQIGASANARQVLLELSSGPLASLGSEDSLARRAQSLLERLEGSTAS
jgi:tetratricopeptide (TPR) repeat protein